ncbi:hypothetical protein CR152_02945 [Massilia violaceinigra]|uniref:Uncharacterized protein n=1 Tax=Massilia violaceinigra TaxID=2045208 RepID=A0A2D2DF19_9BURK|nr:hypothetical protein [Massilia violaceinigra]ATQ73577.1 hypothetical protein CR152_02945 [Massilia violaceinigra]
MDSLKRTLARLGDLHDARVQAIVWDIAAGTLEFKFADIHANLLGLPDYPGLTPASIILREIGDVAFAMESCARDQYISEFSVSQAGGGWRAAVFFRSNGKITATYRSADFPDVSVLSLSASVSEAT